MFQLRLVAAGNMAISALALMAIVYVPTKSYMYVTAMHADIERIKTKLAERP